MCSAIRSILEHAAFVSRLIWEEATLRVTEAFAEVATELGAVRPSICYEVALHAVGQRRTYDVATK